MEFRSAGNRHTVVLVQEPAFLYRDLVRIYLPTVGRLVKAHDCLATATPILSNPTVYIRVVVDLINYLHTHTFVSQVECHQQ